MHEIDLEKKYLKRIIIVISSWSFQLNLLVNLGEKNTIFSCPKKSFCFWCKTIVRLKGKKMPTKS